jgi:hypothetical protein
VHPLPPAPPRLTSRRGPAAPSYAAQSTFLDPPSATERVAASRQGLTTSHAPSRPASSCLTEPEPIPQQGA